MIKISPSPAKSRAILRTSLKIRRMALGENADGAPNVREGRPYLLAHPVYFATVKPILASKGLQYAKLVAWRYFVELADDASLGIAEVNVKSKKAHQFSSFGAAPQVVVHYQFLRSLIQEAAGRGTYSFRLLRIPSIRVLAVWLRSAERGGDLVVPMVPRGHLLTNGRWYKRAEFEAEIKIEVEVLRAQEHEPAHKIPYGISRD